MCGSVAHRTPSGDRSGAGQCPAAFGTKTTVRKSAGIHRDSCQSTVSGPPRNARCRMDSPHCRTIRHVGHGTWLALSATVWGPRGERQSDGCQLASRRAASHQIAVSPVCDRRLAGPSRLALCQMRRYTCGTASRCLLLCTGLPRWLRRRTVPAPIRIATPVEQTPRPQNKLAQAIRERKKLPCTAPRHQQQLDISQTSQTAL